MKNEVTFDVSDDDLSGGCEEGTELSGSDGREGMQIVAPATDSDAAAGASGCVPAAPRPTRVLPTRVMRAERSVYANDGAGEKRPRSEDAAREQSLASPAAAAIGTAGTAGAVRVGTIFPRAPSARTAGEHGFRGVVTKATQAGLYVAGVKSRGLDVNLGTYPSAAAAAYAYDAWARAHPYANGNPRALNFPTTAEAARPGYGAYRAGVGVTKGATVKEPKVKSEPDGGTAGSGARAGSDEPSRPATALIGKASPNAVALPCAAAGGAVATTTPLCALTCSAPAAAALTGHHMRPALEALERSVAGASRAACEAEGDGGLLALRADRAMLAARIDAERAAEANARLELAGARARLGLAAPNGADGGDLSCLASAALMAALADIDEAIAELEHARGVVARHAAERAERAGAVAQLLRAVRVRYDSPGSSAICMAHQIASE